MCGIASVIINKKDNHKTGKRVFKTLMIGNEARGKDSTGVLTINRSNKTFSLFKSTVKSSEFMNRKKFKQVEGDVYIGHTRFATKGAVTERNAHPLVKDKIILVHNGMISNDDELAKSNNNQQFQVDSEVLLPIVQEEAWDKLQKLQGTANFIAWNKETNILYIERHDNPLYWYVNEDEGIIALSSRGNELELIQTFLDGGELKEVDNDTLFKVNLDTLEMESPINLVFETPKYKWDNTLGAYDEDLLLHGVYIPPSERKKYAELDVYDDFDEDLLLQGWTQKEIDEYKSQMMAEYYKDYGDDDDWESTEDADGTVIMTPRKKATSDIVKASKKSKSKFERQLNNAYQNGVCPLCGIDITQEEYRDGTEEWGAGVCTECNSKLVDLMCKHQDGETIDWNKAGKQYGLFLKWAYPDDTQGVLNTKQLIYNL